MWMRGATTSDTSLSPQKSRCPSHILRLIGDVTCMLNIPQKIIKLHHHQCSRYNVHQYMPTSTKFTSLPHNTWCCLRTKCTTIIIIKSNKLMDSTHVLAAAYDDQVHQPPERDSSSNSIFAPAYQTSPIEPVSTILKNVPFNPILEMLTKSITHWKQ